MNTEKLGGYGVTLILVGLAAIFGRALVIGILAAIERGEFALGVGLILVTSGVIAVSVAFAAEYHRQESR
jgi:hypothetical protein